MTWLDILVLIVATYSIFKGYRSGLIKQLASLAAVVACVLISGKIATILLPYLLKLESIPRNITEPLAFIASYIIIFAGFMLLGHMLQSIAKTIKLGTVNKLAGAALSLAKWMIILSIFINLLTKMDVEHLIVRKDLGTESKTYKYIQPIAPEIAPYLKFRL